MSCHLHLHAAKSRHVGLLLEHAAADSGAPIPAQSLNDSVLRFELRHAEPRQGGGVRGVQQRGHAAVEGEAAGRGGNVRIEAGANNQSVLRRAEPSL